MAPPIHLGAWSMALMLWLPFELVSDVCIMAKQIQCGSSHLKDEHIDWVQCMTCSAWYHCVCIGIAQEFFRDQGHNFTC